MYGIIKAVISIHAPRVGSDGGVYAAGNGGIISIHAPRVGSDGHPARPDRSPAISIHAPRVGSDPRRRCCIFPASRFQSTLPVWGATNSCSCSFLVVAISIHAPRVGSDYSAAGGGAVLHHFNPRSPCGERLLLGFNDYAAISNFNPRSPCGERPRHRPGTLQQRRNFNPRSPCGERQNSWRLIASILRISIHAPRVGSDKAGRRTAFKVGHFNPRSPCGERRESTSMISNPALFQSTLPVWGATYKDGRRRSTVIFQSTLPVWGATLRVAQRADGE